MRNAKLGRGLGYVAALLVGLVGPLTIGLAPAAAAQQTASATAYGRHHTRGYVALGDSYSSGEGTFVYTRRTDTVTDRCHRSRLAYAPLLRRDERRLRPLSFVACSGAMTTDFYAPNHDFPKERAQLKALTPRTRAVSLTIGGNDVGFSSIIGACIQTPTLNEGYHCAADPLLTGAVTARIAALAAEGRHQVPGGYDVVAIKTILADIHQRSPHARIYLAGYPFLFGTSTAGYAQNAAGGYTCVVNGAIGAQVDYADAQWFNQTTTVLNGVYQQAVAASVAAGVPATYVSASTFAGHGLCDVKTAWIRPLLLNASGTPRSESFHPTPTGQRRGYERAFHRAGL
jgi:hypothetical protein